MFTEVLPSINNSSNLAAKFHKSVSDDFVYLSRSGDYVLYRLDISKHKVNAFLLYTPVQSVISVSGVDCCYCDGGSLYTIIGRPFADCSQSLPQSLGSSGSPAHSSNSYRCSPVRLTDEHLIFSQKSCRSMVALEHGIAVLCEKESSWTLNIHKTERGSSNLRVCDQPILTVDIPCGNPVVTNPVLVAVQSKLPCDDAASIDRHLFDAIFGEVSCVSKSNSCEGILMSLSDGLVLCVTMPNIDEAALRDTKQNRTAECNYLMCIHQQVISIHVTSFETSCDVTAKTKQAVLIAGILGKIAVLFCDSPADGKPAEYLPLNIVELHVPSPLISLSVVLGHALHIDGTAALWSSQIVLDRCGFHVKTTKPDLQDVAAVQLLRILRGIDGRVECTAVLFMKSGKFFVFNGNLDFDGCERSDDVPVDGSDVKDLLTEIHRSSERLAEIGRLHEDVRRSLSELSCAAHLMLNDQVRKSLKTVVSASWSSADPDDCFHLEATVCNTGDFSIDGRHWHFIVTTTDGTSQRTTKAIPLLRGLVAGETVGTSLKLKCSRPITQNVLPIAVTCSLHYILPSRNLQSVTNGGDDRCPKKPFAFQAFLHESVVDELHFLQERMAGGTAASSVTPERYSGTSLEEAMWEMASRNRQCNPTFRSKGDMSTSIGMPMQHVGCVTLQLGQATKLLHLKDETNDDVKCKILAFLIDASSMARHGSKATVTNAPIQCSLFGQNVELDVHLEGADIIIIKVQVSHPSFLAPMRHAIVRKLKLSDESSDVSKPRDQIASKAITVSKQCFANSMSLRSVISHILVADGGNNDQLCTSLYHELRKNISPKLPFV